MAMVAVGGSIGTGLLLGSGAAIQVAGPAVLVSYALAAVISWMVALALGEMSSVHPDAGSFGIYAELYLNDWASFIARYGYWVSVIAAVGSQVVAAGTYMRVWFPHVPVLWWMIIFGLFLVVVNLFPVEYYGSFEYWFSLIKVVTIFVFILTGAVLLAGGRVPTHYVADGGFAPRGWSASLLALSFPLFSFLGLEMAAISSGEAHSRQAVARATKISFAMLAFIYVGAIAVLVGVIPWRSAGVTQSPFVTVFHLAGIAAAGSLMNFVVLTAALSASNASLYSAARMLFSLARSGFAPAPLGRLTRQSMPRNGLMVSMLGIVGAIVVQLFAPEQAYLYVIGASLAGGMLAWLVSLAAHVRFRKQLSRDQLAALPLRSPFGAAGSLAAFVAIVAAILLTWRVPQSRITVISAGPYLLVLTLGYWLARRKRSTKAANSN